jgi:hypothetical protein
MLDNPKFYVGTVENRDDPLKMGRCQIRIDFIHTKDKSLIPTELLPWAIPMQWIQSAGFAGVGWSPVGPMVGTRVFGIFLDGEDCQIPMIMGTLAGKTGHLSFPAVSEGADSAIGTSEEPSAEATKNGSPKLGAVPEDKMPKAVAIANRLKADFGLTDTQAAGVLGNFLGECPNLVPNTNQGGRKGDPVSGKGSGKGYGWAQWDGVRRQQFVEFAKSRNLDIQSDEANYQFLAHELKTTERSALKELKLTGNLSDATTTWSTKFERAGTPHMDRRINEASQVLKALKGADIPIRTVGVDEDATGTETSEIEVPNDQPPQIVTGTEPLVKFRGRYPYNKTFRSESGHVVEIDDTPGHERLLNYHTIGTYEEINEEGRRVVKVVGDNYTIIAEDDNLYVEGSVNIFVNGNVRASIGGDMVADVKGDYSVQAGGAIRMKGKSFNVETTGGDINFKSSGVLATQSVGSTTFKPGGNFYASAGGNVSLHAGGTFAADGSEVHLGQGTTEAPTAKGAGLNLALHQEELSFLLDDDFDEELVQEAIEEGIITQEELDQELPVGDIAEEPKPEDKTEPAVTSGDCGGLDKLETVPDNTKISTYFKLGDVSSWAAASRQKVVAQRGLTVGQIACNLSMLSKNCLDKIKAKYPNMIITSGFRTQKNGKSQHEIGQACDMQFSGYSNADLLGVAKWIRDESGIPFDQLILEHKQFGTGKSWIHISYKKGDNRQMAFTMNNHKMYNRTQLVGHA